MGHVRTTMPNDPSDAALCNATRHSAKPCSRIRCRSNHPRSSAPRVRDAIPRRSRRGGNPLIRTRRRHAFASPFSGRRGPITPARPPRITDFAFGRAHLVAGSMRPCPANRILAACFVRTGSVSRGMQRCDAEMRGASRTAIKAARASHARTRAATGGAELELSPVGSAENDAARVRRDVHSA